MDGWQRLPDRVVEKLLHHIAARARAWQAQMGIATREPTRAFVSRLFSCAHSLKDRMDLGFIHGMSFKHTPKHAPSWGEEATYWLRQLNEELSPRAPRGDSGSAPRSSSCVCEAGAGEDEGALRELVIPEEWPLLHYTRERRVVVLGGTRRPEC